jgi:hypothetical protein
MMTLVQPATRKKRENDLLVLHDPYLQTGGLSSLECPDGSTEARKMRREQRQCANITQSDRAVKTSTFGEDYSARKTTPHVRTDKQNHHSISKSGEWKHWRGSHFTKLMLFGTVQPCSSWANEAARSNVNLLLSFSRIVQF